MCNKKEYCKFMDLMVCMKHVPYHKPEYYLNNSKLKEIITNKKYKDILRKKLTNQIKCVPSLGTLVLSEAIIQTQTFLENEVITKTFDIENGTTLCDKFTVANDVACRRMKKEGMTKIQTRSILLFWVSFYSVLKIFEGKKFNAHDNVFHLVI